MKKRKESFDLIKRFSANTPQLSFGLKENFSRNLNKKLEHDNVIQATANLSSSSHEDNSQYYDQFLRTLQKSAHIKHKKSKEIKKSSPIKEIQIVEPQSFKDLDKKEYKQRHSMLSDMNKNKSNAKIFLSTKNMSSQLDSNVVKGLNPGIASRLSDIKRDSLKPSVQLEMIEKNVLQEKGTSNNNNNYNNIEEDNAKISKTIHINLNTNNLKHSKTNKASIGYNNSNLQTNSLETCPIQRRKRLPGLNPKVKANEQRNWFLCCLPIK